MHLVFSQTDRQIGVLHIITQTLEHTKVPYITYNSDWRAQRVESNTLRAHKSAVCCIYRIFVCSKVWGSNKTLRSLFEQLAWRTSPASVRQSEAQHITTQQLNASARRPSHAGRITISLMHNQLRLTLKFLERSIKYLRQTSNNCI